MASSDGEQSLHGIERDALRIVREPVANDLQNRGGSYNEDI
jgi:hypothetical protein